MAHSPRLPVPAADEAMRSIGTTDGVPPEGPRRVTGAGTSQQDWPIQADYCFARVVLGNLFYDVWYDHIDGRPAYKHLTVGSYDVQSRLSSSVLVLRSPSALTHSGP
jgi:hypothetical protein